MRDEMPSPSNRPTVGRAPQPPGQPAAGAVVGGRQVGPAFDEAELVDGVVRLHAGERRPVLPVPHLRKGVVPQVAMSGGG